jgi:hypothetical protein
MENKSIEWTLDFSGNGIELKNKVSGFTVLAEMKNSRWNIFSEKFQISVVCHWVPALIRRLARLDY